MQKAHATKARLYELEGKLRSGEISIGEYNRRTFEEVAAGGNAISWWGENRLDDCIHEYLLLQEHIFASITYFDDMARMRPSFATLASCCRAHREALRIPISLSDLGLLTVIVDERGLCNKIAEQASRDHANHKGKLAYIEEELKRFTPTISAYHLQLYCKAVQADLNGLLSGRKGKHDEWLENVPYAALRHWQPHFPPEMRENQNGFHRACVISTVLLAQRLQSGDLKAPMSAGRFLSIVILQGRTTSKRFEQIIMPELARRCACLTPTISARRDELKRRIQHVRKRNERKEIESQIEDCEAVIELLQNGLPLTPIAGRWSRNFMLALCDCAGDARGFALQAVFLIEEYAQVANRPIGEVMAAHDQMITELQPIDFNNLEDAFLLAGKASGA